MRCGCMNFSGWAGGCCVRSRILALMRHGVFVVSLLACAAVASAQDTVVKFNPASTTVDFTLGATLHTVHGSFKLKSGEIHLDATTGKASGSIVVDATSGNSDDSGRDKNMHQNVLESAKYSEIVFSPAQITPAAGHTLKEALASKSATQMQAVGNFRLHGQDHDLTLNLSVDNDGAGHAHVTTTFPVPYVKWGLKSPNTFFLHVSDSVDLAIHTTAEISPSH
jgi:polyisoprenoid-binding protein YceI